LRESRFSAIALSFAVKAVLQFCKGKPLSLSGFFLKKKPPSAVLETLRKLENRSGTSPRPPFCGTLASMGSKDKGRKEPKKAPKPKPKPEPSRREVFTPAPPK
jgi:hypothetical protein